MEFEQSPPHEKKFPADWNASSGKWFQGSRGFFNGGSAA
jgi:hypothetical protein